MQSVLALLMYFLFYFIFKHLQGHIILVIIYKYKHIKMY